MRLRSSFWIGLGVLLLAGAWLFWPHGARRATEKNSPQKKTPAIPGFATIKSASSAPQFLAGKISTNALLAVVKTNPFPWRLSNTKKSIGELAGNRHAILLENALIDTDAKLDLAIPKNLQAPGEPGAYIVQASGPINAAFRAQLAAAGAQIVSYIPNDAYLVTISSGGATGLSGQPDVQSVIPYEPYYKLPASLMPWTEQAFPPDRQLRVAAYPNTADAVKAWLENSGAQIVTEEPSSPFGKTFVVQNVTDVAALAQQPILQRVEPVYRRVSANDLSRVALGISEDTVTSTNYMNLSGSNVLVEVNDSGIDAVHPDFSATGSAESGPSGISRVTGDAANSLVDESGHGTFVAGVIAGNGSESYSITNIPQGSVTNADFRGKAPAADLFSVAFLDVNGNSFDVPDAYLQAEPALTNALISNNSWTYSEDNVYDLAAASYDAAVRDALPLVTGSQPVLFVFAAGNDGGGDDSGGGGDADTILSPGTAKNVITVGALQEARNITNIVTDINGNSNAVWQAGTQNGNLVASYSSRGNVGVGTEGTFGRFKPDVVAPGSFVVSTRSEQWDQAAYYNPTNFYLDPLIDQFIGPNSQNNYNLSLNFFPPNVEFNSNIVSVTIQIVPNADSPSPFPILPIYVSHANFPNPTVSSTYDFVTTNNQVSIPNPDGGNSYLAAIQNGNLFFSIVNTNSERVDFDLIEEITATNELGNYFTVLSNLNDTIGPWYRYESGTSMAAPAVSGALALMQDYFTNTLHVTPSPALLKAMLINGAQPVGDYSYAFTNGLNFEGWGLVNVPDSVPAGITNLPGSSCSSFLMDQSPTNALATGDSQTFMVTIDTNDFADIFPLQVTLAWTDPPGNPAAAIKLVNNLDLVITNLDTGEVYFGNDIAPNTTFNAPWDTNTAPNLDVINNIENIIIPPTLGGNYSVTVIGRNVNVNAVTAQTNNVVQDYALVISCSEGQVTTAITVTPGALVSNPTSDQQITAVLTGTAGIATNGSSIGGIFFNQLAGANSPLLGTNTVDAVSNFNGTAVITLGMTNQWHFYVVQPSTLMSNAAFVTFTPNTLSIPRMGVFADATQNPTQPDADIDLYVSTDPSLTNLNPVVISNCVNGTQIGASVANVFNGASLGGGGTEFVVDTNSSSTQVYYVGVKSETAEATEYGFLPVFSQQPFSQGGGNNPETVYGLLLPVNIPDGSPKHPGTGYVFGLAIQPIQVQDVIVTNQIVHQNFGDLTGTLTHDGAGVVLNNHDSPGLPLPPGPYNFIYDDGPAPVANSQPPDGPGSLQNFQGQQGIGPWILAEVDNSLTQTGAVTGFSLLITPHVNLGNQGVNISVQPGSFFFGFIDVPVGVTNLTISATNTTPTPDTSTPQTLGELFEKFGAQPTPTATPPTNFDNMILLTNFPPASTIDPGNSIFIGPSSVPPIQPGRYFVTLYNASLAPQTYFVIANFGVAQVASVNFGSSGSVPILDDAVSYAFITNNPTATQTNEIIAALNVGIRVDHPRISDLVFHLISPDGTRYLLMENRGGTSTNGAGLTILSTNDIANFSNTGTTNASTNFVFVSQSSGTLPISWNFFSIPDQMTVYDSTNSFDPAHLIFDTGMVNGTGQTNLLFTTAVGALTIIINQFGNTNANGDEWNYTAGGVSSNYTYLAFTEDTNLTTIPIKFAPTPFVPIGSSNLFYLPEQDLSPLNGQSAFGTWQLEIQDDRVGAGLTNSLLSWQLQFIFADTNFVPSVPVNTLTNGMPQTNVVPANSISWFLVNVPVNADIATNDLIFATAPVNLLFNSTVPDTNGDFTLLVNSVGGSTNLTGMTSPPLVPGSFYYLGVQNTNNFAVTNALEVDFHLFAASSPFAFTQPAQAVTGTNAQLNGMATPNGLPATAWFEWGTNTSYGNQTPSVSVGNSMNVVYVTNSISLTPNVPYHFRLVVSNAFAVVKGFDQILDEANVVVWGANFAGQLAAPAGLSNVVAIAGAYDHSLALKNNETAVIWGDDTFGQTNIPAGLNNNLLAVAGGESYSLALRNTGIVIAWGANIFPGETNVPAGASNNVVAIASGQYSSLALQSNGTVVAWGANISGLTNVPASLSNNAVAIAGGSFHNLAIKNDGTVVAWGDDSIGQTNVPATLTNVVAIAAGSFHSLALKSDGTVVAWGDDSAGQMDVPTNLINVVAIAAGGFHSLALKSDGSIVSWGDDSAGQRDVPLGLTNFVAIAAGNLHSLALTPQFVASLTNIVSDLPSGAPQTNNISPGGINYFRISVPPNADFATNILLFAQNGPLNVWFTTNSPPSIATNATLLFVGSTNGSTFSVLSTTSSPTNITPNMIYYLGVQNTNSVPVNYAIEVDFHLLIAPPVVISSITATNIGSTNGFLLQWFAPTNDIFEVQIATNLASPVWQTIATNIIYTGGPTATNGLFTFFDDGSQVPFGPVRFYRLIVSGSGTSSNTPPSFVATPPNQIINPLDPLIVTNAATDAQSPPQILSYSLTTTVTGANQPAINNNGIITWTPDVSQAGTSNVITTIVSDNGSPSLSATNSFVVIVTPVPPISSIVISNGFYLLTWLAPTNDIFEVQVATNLASPVWQTIATNVMYIGPGTPTNGVFSYLDDGTQVPFGPLRFYRLILTGVTALPSPPPPVIPISNIIITNGDFLLTWLAPTNDIFQVQVATNLASPVWQTIATNIMYTGPVTPTNGVFSYLDDGTQVPFGSLRFYRLILTGVSAPASPAVPISSIIITNGNFLLTWSAPTNDQFNVRWTTNIVPPLNWVLFSNNIMPYVVTSTNGTFTFLDTNAPLLMKFYDLILLP